MHIYSNNMEYDMIIGSDLMHNLEIILNFNDKTVIWNDGIIDMKSTDFVQENSYHVDESDSLMGETKRILAIQKAKYQKADINQVTADFVHLNDNQKTDLRNLLRKYDTIFDGTLCTWKGRPYDIQLRKDVIPYHAQAYSIPRTYETTHKEEVERLCKIGVLKRVNRSKCAAPSFIIPKKDKSVRFITDFREVNKRVIHKPYP